MATRFGHVNLVARDWRALAAFYEDVFGCEPVGAERDIAGDWVDRATGLDGARITGRHYRLPGGDATLEIFSYDAPKEQTTPTADRLGFGHVAFRVDDVAATLARFLAAGGQRLGEIAHADVAGEAPSPGPASCAARWRRRGRPGSGPPRSAGRART